MSEAAELSPRLVHRLGTVAEIVEGVAAAYGLTAADVLGTVRTKAVVEARQCAYLVARRCTRLSLTEIAAGVRRDHTTVMSGLKRAEALRVRDRWTSATVAELLERFGEIEESVTQ